MLEHFFLDKEKYKTLSLKSRMIMDMVAYKANYIFSDTVIDTKVKEHPNDWSTNQAVYTIIEEMKSQKNLSFEGKYHLERLYESEFGSITETEKTFIDETAKTYANVALKTYGWIKVKKESSIKQMEYKKLKSRELLARGIYKDHEYFVISFGSHPCGYVKLNKENINKAKDAPCHGSVTYSETYLNISENERLEGSFIGWDYAHFSDYYYCGEDSFGNYKYTTEEVISECINVIDWLKTNERKML